MKNYIFVATSFDFRKLYKMLKKMVYLGSFFIGVSLIASQELELTDIQRGPVIAVQSSDEDGHQLQETYFYLPGSCEQSCRSTLMNCHENTRNRYMILRNTEYSSDCKACTRNIGISCIFAGLIVVCVLNSESHTYRIYNREKASINIHYRPGCGNNKDCIKTIYPHNHAKIVQSGHLTKLCAEYASWSKNGYECVTDHGLKSFNWYVHDHITFTRGKGSQEQLFNETAASFRSYQDPTLSGDAPYYNLPGSIDLEKK